ncbi:unnamed protein product [Urochloa decumbens]|uniref:RING-type E3 ubiquitin transferase n=1 Tax=Urochloa decumbens TaxID=240449 RepID=A0ABC9ADG9_9POAL
MFRGFLHFVAMETKDSDTAGKSKCEAQDDGGHKDGSDRPTGSIAVEAFSCRVCAQPLSPPIFQCPAGHFFCSSCHDKLPEEKCKFCSGPTLSRSLGMERAVRSILVDCRYAKEGCTEKTAYCNKSEHEKVCPLAPRFLCPEPGCGFAGLQGEELLDHLTGNHRWPSTMFWYYAAFDICVAQPGTQVLQSANDGQLFLVNARQAAAPPAGLVVSIVCVPPHQKPTGFGCRVSFSCFGRHRSTWTLDDLPSLRISDWPPAEYVCVVPKALDGAGDGAGAVLTVTIVCADDVYEDDDLDAYISSDSESDEGDSDSS